MLGRVLLVAVAVGLAVAALRAWFAQHDGFAAGFYGLMAAGTLWLTALATTEVVATFDGARGVLTIVRKRPWGTSSVEDIAFGHVFDIETSATDPFLARMLSIGIAHSLDILLAGERRIRLGYDRAEQEEIDRTITAVRALMFRGPRGGS